MKIKTYFLPLILFLISAASVQAQIVYKIPDGVFPMNWNESGFKGMLFLQKDSPSGLFIAFPENGKTSDALRERAAKFIAPMMAHDLKDKETMPFDIKPIRSHDGDIDGRGRYYFVKGEKSSVQILFFERQTPAATVLYGYFASRGNDETKSKIWVGDDLKEPKLFSKFIKTLVVK